MKLENIHNVYFVGIGGIGMSAIARWFNQRGVRVGGYDRVKTVLTSRLEEEGMWIHYDDHKEAIPAEFLNTENTLIIFTPAIPKNHGELTHFQTAGFEVKKRSEVLGIISRGHYTIAVGGTHGKTTTSSMVAHLLNQSEKGCSAFIGGIMANYDSNLIVGNEAAPVVVEADEFDRSFLRLSPNYSILTSADPDHLDIYGDDAEIKRTFGEFLLLSGSEGKTLIHHVAASSIAEYLENDYFTYGIDNGDIQANALRAVDGSFIFNYDGRGQKIKDIRLNVPGFHNVENAIAAITVGLDMGMSAEDVKAAIDSYKGVKRRFEYIIKTPDFVFIDDYAHHPTEISAFLKSTRALFPQKKLTAIFQPHLFSRTNDFQDGFAESLALADEIILLDIYPAREEPIPGVSSEIILDKINKESKVLTSKAELLDMISTKHVELLCTIGAGDIDTKIPELKSFYLNKLNIHA